MSAAPLAPARPIAVSILGWVFIAFSSFSVLTSGFGLVFWRLMARASPRGEFPSNLDESAPGFATVSWVFRYFDVLLIAQLLLAGFSIYAAMRFLKLRPWSRRFFEAVNWIGLVWTVVFGVFFAIGWAGMTAGGAEGPGEQGPPAFLSAFGVVAAVLAVAVNGAFPAALIWLLRSKFVRPAFEHPVLPTGEPDDGEEGAGARNLDAPAAEEPSPRVTVESADGGQWVGVFELQDSPERTCSLKLRYSEQEILAQGPDYFEALCRIREQLAPVGHTVHCYGASRNVFPSGMARDMGAGLKAYRLQMGRSSDLADLVSIFATGPDVDPVSVAEQKAFYDAWLGSFRE